MPRSTGTFPTALAPCDRHEWDTIQESGKQLEEVHAPGHVGLRNVGNTCYMNSLMQVLFSLPEFQHR